MNNIINKLNILRQTQIKQHKQIKLQKLIIIILLLTQIFTTAYTMVNAHNVAEEKLNTMIANEELVPLEVIEEME